MGTAPRMERAGIQALLLLLAVRCIRVRTSVLAGAGAGVERSASTPSSCLLWMGTI